MPTEKPFLDQLAKLLVSAADATEELRKEIDGAIKARLEKLAVEMNFVPREEFEAVKAMAAKAQTEVEALKARLDALEKNPPA